ncbi:MULTISPECIES: MerR family transcriptional regulator [unclassified Gilliamella]|jgi:hypothetical protein|uniref:MerR family transcriptional regulator n=1 Tax=unclassified Gilliamella TaxID=2685620 RepID=UPI00080D9ECB|nr:MULTISPECIES: MerR family transcriptional regulator [Gilliamella]MCO6557704.1 helix-turn-helix domain-containing protein [Gilliamella sp.]NUF27035.1 helix-turn-helix domain-containing protein [Gilliamella sp. ESL0254]OCG35558.1 hypothetical protein A9G32_06965 [Gilliamella apicola]OCG50376.1 hypothetical protein A9G26_06995 [Gilliamella apicola]OCG51056.1 hypothetical protein A9G27_00930 [Gilliamella apicola]
MTPRISIAISAPYVTVDEFARVSGMNPRTVKKYISEGKLPIRKKQITGKYDRSTTFINMVALTLEGAKAFNPELNIKEE